MANWYGMSRSNYFRVKDEAAFRTEMEKYDVEVIADKDGLFGLLGDDEGYWPSCVTETEEDFDFIDKVAPHLADGEIAVFVTVGHEKSRYGTGYAVAFNNKGEAEDLDLSLIYAFAEQRWGKRPTEASY